MDQSDVPVAKLEAEQRLPIPRDGDVFELSRGLIRGQTESAGWCGGHFSSVQLDGQNLVAAIPAEELLDVIIRRSVNAQVVDPDQIRRPLPAVDMREQRRVGGHADDVGIAFQAGHESGFGKRAFEVVPVVDADDLDALRGVFAHEHFRALAIVVVVAVRIVEEPDGIGVAMFVHDVGVQLAQFRPEKFETIVGGRGAGGW